MEINLINVNISQHGIPAEFLLFLGIQRTKDKSYIALQDSQTNKEVLRQILQNLIHFFKINNVFLLNDCTYATNKISIDNKLGLFFSSNLNENQIKTNTNLKPFISEFEKLFGKIPFYTQKNKYLEKYFFINDVVLQFGQEGIIH